VEVAGVHADLVRARLDGREGEARVEVDVRHERRAAARAHLGYGLGGPPVGDRKAHEAAAELRKLVGLAGDGLGIVRVDLDHRLHDDRVPASQRNGTRRDGPRPAPRGWGW